MIDMSLQQSEPAAVSQEPLDRQRRVIGCSMLITLMILLGLPVFVPAVVLYCGIRFGSRSAAVALFAAAALSTVSVAFSGYPQDTIHLAYSLVAGSVLALGVPAIVAVPLVKRGESFGRVLMVLLAVSAVGMAVTELLFRAAAGYSVYAAHVAQAREAMKVFAVAYKTRPADAAQVARWGNYYSSTLVTGSILSSAAIYFVLSLVMFGRLPAGRELAARVDPDTTGTYRLRNLSLPDWVLFLFVLGGLAPLVTGLAHTIAANALMLAVFLYVVQGFALLRFLLASLGVGFIGALLFMSLSIIGSPLLGLAGLFDPFFDFRHFKKRKDDSHESHSD